MAIEFNITADKNFFLGEDKIIDFTIFELDGVTPLEVSGLPLEWSVKKNDKDPDPGIITKGAGTGLSVIGVWSSNPTTNTQRVRLTFVPADTNPDLTAALATPYVLKAGQAYRHSLKRKDISNANVLSFGSITWRQATER